MAYNMNNRSYGNNYYEAEKEVIRESPYGSYSSEYNRVDEYGNRVMHPDVRYDHRGEVMAEVIPGHRHRHHSGHPVEVIERVEERIVDNAYDSYRRNMNY
ncbi:uncharacterized protein LOC130800842 [Amaranthus tricolor]|uniref:uncharacterized protein LOC130800842 n=1 Tax=Amaranthus tricolor TaxID=29722 RepID=UPI0025904F36|nr:uncharacterized protein LOC130800842 [Amaranthus tricolor]